jgi:hypothetical protein
VAEHAARETALRAEPEINDQTINDQTINDAASGD